MNFLLKFNKKFKLEDYRDEPLMYAFETFQEMRSSKVIHSKARLGLIGCALQ